MGPATARVVAGTLVFAVFATATGRAFANSTDGRSDVPKEDGSRLVQSICLDVGALSAVGELGVTYEIGMAFGAGDSYLALTLEAGIGVGLSGPQFSVMPKFKTGSAKHHFVVGVGASLAVPGQNGTDDTGAINGPTNNPATIPWLNIDAVGYEFVASSGFTFLAAGGATISLGSGCYGGGTIVSCTDVSGFKMAQGRLGFGYSF